MNVPPQKSLAVAVGKNLGSQGEMVVNEAGDSIMGLCLFSVLYTSEAFRWFPLPRYREYASLSKIMWLDRTLNMQTQS